MNPDVLALVRAESGADRVHLVQPVLLDEVLVVGAHWTATATGVAEAPGRGTPVRERAGGLDLRVARERYHLDGGGVDGVPGPGRVHREPPGLAPLGAPHVLLPGVADGRAAWLVLDGHVLGFLVLEGAGERAPVPPAARRLRRHLAQTLEDTVSALTGTGTLLVRGGHVVGADRRGAAWAEQATEAPGTPGVRQGALVVARGLDSPAQDEVVSVRPVRPPIAPWGLELTPTQRAIARYLASAATLREIAEARGCSTSTVSRHRDDIYEALGVSRRLELADRLLEV